MALKYKFKTRDEVPAELLPLYTERDGAFVLDVEGAVEKAKLDEFRATNGALLKERDELKARFDGIDPKEVRKLADEKRALEEAAQLKAGEFEKVLESRLKAQKAGFEKELTGVATERDALHARLAAIQIDQAVVAEATRRGLRPTALADVTARARSAFRLVNGMPQAFEADGTPRAGQDGVTPMTLAEWVDALVSDAPHLFAANAGGGAAGSGPGGAAGAKQPVSNPFARATWNLTEQMRLLKTNPQLAAQMKATA
jgi:hypothetical protein